MSPLLVSGLLLGVLGALTPVLLRRAGMSWLRLAAVPLATLLFAGAFTLAGNGPLLPPLLAGLSAARAQLRAPAPGVAAEPPPLPGALQARVAGLEGGPSAIAVGLGPASPGGGLGMRAGRRALPLGSRPHRPPLRHTRGVL